MLRNLMLPLADVLGEPEDSPNLKLRNNQANTTDALFGGGGIGQKDSVNEVLRALFFLL